MDANDAKKSEAAAVVIGAARRPAEPARRRNAARGIRLEAEAAIGLSRDGVDAERAFYVTNVLTWRPPGNRDPEPDEIAVSLPFLRRHVELIQPDLLVLMGVLRVMHDRQQRGLPTRHGSAQLAGAPAPEEDAEVVRESLAAAVTASRGAPILVGWAGQRSAGAHPYLTTPEHTAQAREILGGTGESGPALVVEHAAVVAERELGSVIDNPVVTRDGRVDRDISRYH